MKQLRPIHPERPVLRAAAAVAVSLGVHAGALALLVVWALVAISAARKAEEAKPREVALATIDAGEWARNRAVVELPPPLARQRTEARRPPPAPAEVKPPPPRAEAGASAAAPPAGSARPLPADERGGGEPNAPGAGDGASAGPDLQPRPLLNRPLAMKFDPVGDGTAPLGEGTAFSSFTVQNPEAWRFANFFNRAVESMNSVYRYELGAPLPPSLYARWVNEPGQTAACSYTWVALDAGGKVVEAQVRKSSGMTDLDALILEVIRRTAPFVNVPPGLLDERGAYRDTWGLCLVRGARRG